jgi:SAM-dependent methyltransferase
MKSSASAQTAFADRLYWEWQGRPNPASIASEVGFMEQTLQLPPGAKVLDLGCGLGFHSLEFARRGYQITGLEASGAFLEEAKAAARQVGMPVRFIPGDMTCLDFTAEFDGVILWGYTFGLFSEEGNFQTLAGIRRALKPGGQVLIDTLNFRPPQTGEHPITTFSREDSPYLFLTQDTFDEKEKRFGFTVVGIDLTSGKKSEMNFSWRNYTDEELSSLVAQAGLELIAIYGDDPAIVDWEHYESSAPYPYTPEAFTAESAKRILLCRAP